MAPEERSALREEIKDVLAETFTAAELFTEPTERAIAETCMRLFIGPIHSQLQTLVNYDALRAPIRAQVRAYVREYMLEATQRFSTDVYNAAQQKLPY